MERHFAALIAIAITLVPANPALAQQQSARPKLAVVITVEGLTSEQFNRYGALLSGGVGRLARGAVFANGAADGQPEPAIAAATKRGSTSSVTAFVGPQANNALEDFDQQMQWDGTRFVTGGDGPAPLFIPDANVAIGRLIGTAERPLTPPPACGGDASARHFERVAGNSAAFSASPALDGALLVVAAGTIGELRMGTDPIPDLLVVRLPGTARAIATYGANSVGSCIQLHSLDRDLAGFFSQLDRGGLDYVVALSGSAGSGTVPIAFFRAGMPTLNVADAASTGDIAPTLAAMIGLPPGEVMGGRCLNQVPGINCSR